jgi:hypothetical protein
MGRSSIGLGECDQILPEAIGVAIRKKSLKYNVNPPPDGTARAGTCDP